MSTQMKKNANHKNSHGDAVAIAVPTLRPGSTLSFYLGWLDVQLPDGPGFWTCLFRGG
jgi:hypothetical protein